MLDEEVALRKIYGSYERPISRLQLPKRRMLEYNPPSRSSTSYKEVASEVSVVALILLRSRAVDHHVITMRMMSAASRVVRLAIVTVIL